MPATLRRTRKLLTQLPDAGDATTPAMTALGDWYVHRFQLGRTPWLLAVSETTYLAIVLPARDVRTLAARFPEAVEARLARIAFPTDMIAREIAAMHPMAVGPTASSRRTAGAPGSNASWRRCRCSRRSEATRWWCRGRRCWWR